MTDWKLDPLGFAVVDETQKGDLAIHHVSIRDEGVFYTGAWVLRGPSSKEIQDRLRHWIPIGTVDGITKIKATIKESFTSANLTTLVTACEAAEDSLNETWREYQNKEPKKRANLVPLGAHTWPSVTKDVDAARILKQIGRQPPPESTPSEMRGVLALARLVGYISETWYELEGERISRAYLNNGDTRRAKYPPTWLKAHPPYWPKVV